MRLPKIKIAAILVLCLTQTSVLFGQDFPPPPVPPPPPGLPIDDYVPYMILLALVIGVIYFLKAKNSTKTSDS
jgi:hypothetical protein